MEVSPKWMHPTGLFWQLIGMQERITRFYILGIVAVLLITNYKFCLYLTERGKSSLRMFTLLITT